jgi:hypothetical protein
MTRVWSQRHSKKEEEEEEESKNERKKERNVNYRAVYRSFNYWLQADRCCVINVAVLRDTQYTCPSEQVHMPRYCASVVAFIYGRFKSIVVCASARWLTRGEVPKQAGFFIDFV